MSILVTGGAGYIGSATVELLRQSGRDVVVLDNLVYGHKGALAPDVPLYEGDIGDSALITKIAREHSVSSCIHFAAYAYVGESVQKPLLYYRNNLASGLGLLEGLLEARVSNIVFSSTCATYGEPQRIPLDEEHPQSPINPYGASKWMFERVLKDTSAATDLKFVALRYFNASGAVSGEEGEGLRTIGEDHSPETHLIPLILDVALGKRQSIQVFGTDYPTPDGTAIRDYIHILDLGAAHLNALSYLENGGQSDFFNLGNGSGYSVKEVVEASRRITGHEIPVVNSPRRAGDPARLIADANKAKTVLGWNPQYPELDAILGSAWKWHSSHPDGYGD
ncbi:UDP-glucose 4-epimerase [Abditibacteriota bacterium]|nr:UDP-glucose 4-epimerase [Abditibacteriota bacterium]